MRTAGPGGTKVRPVAARRIPEEVAQTPEAARSD